MTASNFIGIADVVEAPLRSFLYLAAVFLGCLFGLIFFLDGWKKSSSTDLLHAPKMRGLLLVLGGAVVNAVPALAAQDTKSVAIYTATVVITVLVALTAMVIYAWGYAFDRLGRLYPDGGGSLRFWGACRHALAAMQDGLPSFYNDLDDVREVGSLERMRWFVEFTTGVFLSLLPPQRAADRRVSLGRGSLGKLLGDFLLITFEDGRIVESHRACIYTRRGETLEFLARAHPQTKAFSRKPLGNKSLAAKALAEPTEIQSYPPKAGKDQWFEHRGQERESKTVLAIAIPASDKNKVDWVLCVDCLKRGFRMEPELIGTTITTFAHVLSAVRDKQEKGGRSGGTQAQQNRKELQCGNPK